jgi:hypothetical protein
MGENVRLAQTCKYRLERLLWPDAASIYEKLKAICSCLVLFVQDSNLLHRLFSFSTIESKDSGSWNEPFGARSSR